MWGKIVVLLVVLGAILVSSGCSTSYTPRGTRSGSGPVTTPTPAPTPKYGIGDVVVKNSHDEIGEVVQNYDPGSGRDTTRTVLIGDFGDVSFYEGGGTRTFSLNDFENQYIYKKGTVDNPHNLPSPTREYKPKYSVGQVVTRKNTPLEGIKILSYDYPRDAYTYIYVNKKGSAWVASDNISYTGARTDVEKRYA